MPDSSDDDARDFLQQRMAGLSRVALFLVCAMTVSFNGRRVLTGTPWRDFIVTEMNGFAVAQLVVWAIVWRYCTSGARPIGVLRILEGALLVFVAALISPMALIVDEGATLMPETTNLTNSLALLLLLRAAYIPSSWRRTAIVSALTIVPGSIVAAMMYDRYPELGNTTPLLSVIGWHVGFAFVATVISGVIYGLRKQARDAMQLGQYRLEAKIGEGGMGAVYRASHAMLRRKTAVKLLPPDKAGEASIQRFEREVQLTAQLTHPNTVAIYDYGRTPDGLFYYVMELLDGIDLEQLIAVDGPQTPARVAHILQQVCGALAEAHDLGLIHRDIKPANVILCRRGGDHDVAKVVDFGLVKQVETSDEEAAKLSNVNVLTGTPLYLSPEAITDPDTVDARSDIYALGAVAFFLLTGEPPFEGKGIVEVCSHHLHTDPPSPSERRGDDLPGALEALVLRCLAKKPADRFQDAAAMRAALEHCDLPAWTDGRAWWEAHPDVVIAPAASTEVSASLVIDLHERAS